MRLALHRVSNRCHFHLEDHVRVFFLHDMGVTLNKVTIVLIYTYNTSSMTNATRGRG